MHPSTTQRSRSTLARRSRRLAAGLGLALVVSGCAVPFDQGAAPEAPTPAVEQRPVEPVPGPEPETAEAESASTGSQIQSVAVPSSGGGPADPEPSNEVPDTDTTPGSRPGSKPAIRPSGPAGGPSQPAPDTAVASALPELACSSDSFVLPGLDPSFNGSLEVMDTAYDDVESHCSMVDDEGQYYSYTIVGGDLTVADYQQIVDVSDAEITASGSNGFSYQRVGDGYTTVVEVWEAEELLVELAVIVEGENGSRRASEMIEFLLLFTFDPASF